MVLFSFIINVKKYDSESLKQCIISLVSQDCSDWEIVINSEYFRIVEKILKKHDLTNVNLISINADNELEYNNNAIIEATGEYVCFLNSNEFLLKNKLSQVIKSIKGYNSNMISTNYYLKNDFEYSVYTTNLLKKFDKTEETVSDKYGLPIFLSKNFFRKDFLIKNNINFSEKSYLSNIFFLINVLDNINHLLTLPLNLVSKINDISKDNFENFYDILIENKNLLFCFSSDKKLYKYLENIFTHFNGMENISIPMCDSDKYELISSEINDIKYLLKKIPSSKIKHELKIYLLSVLDIIYNSIKRYEILISVIIPAYNVEYYLDQCLTSLLNQTLKNFEIIIVDDQSTDKTRDIIEYYKKLDNRIKFIKVTEKSGGGGCRNIGMDFAKGKYILFVDSDDWIDSYALEELFKCAEKNKTQILFFKAINYDMTKNIFYYTDYYDLKKLKDYENKIFSVNDLPKGPFFISVSVWNKLYLKSFLDRIHAKFPKILIYEDNPFFFKTFCEAKRVYITDRHYYNRRRRPGSITTTQNIQSLDNIDIIELEVNVFIENELYDIYKVLLINYIISKLINTYEITKNNYGEEFFLRAKLKLLKLMFDYNLYDDFQYIYKKNRPFFESLIDSENYKEFQHEVNCLKDK